MNLVWRRCYGHLLRVEGGFFDHPSDPGGATYAGVALRTVRTLDADGDGVLDFDLDGDGDVDREDIKALAGHPEKIEAFYRGGYWEPTRAGELPAHLAMFVFDAAVHHGVGAAALLLQRAVGVKADGVIGPATVEAARSHWPGALDSCVIQRLDLFDRIHVARPKSLAFREGWRRRLLITNREALYLSRDLALPGAN